jgi:hypothetical protein
MTQLSLVLKRHFVAAIFWVLIGLGGQVSAQEADSSKIKVGPLFEKEEMLEFGITANMKPLLKDRTKKGPTYRWALLTRVGTTAEAPPLKVRIKVRGNFRRSAANCLFPPLLLNIPSKKDKNTVFERQNLLKLVTHCQSDDYVVQEYLIYKMYNLLTEYSFKARLARVTYQDSAGQRAPETHAAFLIEDENDLAKRTRTKNIYRKQTAASLIDSVNMATVAVFEYMIGNTDWSLPFLHNIKLVATNDKILAVPYDFDHSGMVEAKYARPAEELELVSVRQRLYRGITYSPAVLQQVFEKFKRAKPQIYALYASNPLLKERYIKRAIEYLDSFYEIIDNPKSIKNIFVLGGGRAGTSGVVIKGLN